MKNILLTITLLGTLSFANVATQPSPTTKPSTKPIIKPSYDRLTKDDYVYNPYYNDEELAKEKTLKEEKEQLEILEKKINTKKDAEQKALQKKNKAEYDKAMKKFDNREKTIQTENSIIISDKPIK